LGLTAHITFSVGWFGAVAGFLALAIVGVNTLDSQLVRSSYLSMDLIAWFVIIPLCLGSSLTGVIQSLGTPWGLFKHYWVAVKLIMTIIGTVILLAHMQPISYLADVASKQVLSYSDLRGLRMRLIFDAGAALLVLLGTITLSVYKPWGKTKYGLRNKSTKSLEVRTSKPWGLYILLGLISIVILLFIATHLMSGGLSHH
jgi:hypothetical protein